MAYLTFMNPLALLLILVLPLLVLFYIDQSKKKKSKALLFSNLGLLKKAQKKTKHRFRKHLNFSLLILVLFMLIIGFADPHIPLNNKKDGVNVVLSIDVSGSMRATDYSPNRLEVAKTSAVTLIDSLETKDSIGVVKFGNGATTVSYLTPFKTRAIDKVKAIPMQGCEGTAIGDGLATAVDMASSIPNKKKIVILLSDGEQTAGNFKPEEAIRFASENKIQVYTIGMGSTGDVQFACPGAFGFPQYGKASLKEETLKQIATSTGGKYFKSVNKDTLDKIYKTISEDIKREKEPTSIRMWFFILAFILTIVEIYYRYGRYAILRRE